MNNIQNKNCIVCEKQFTKQVNCSRNEWAQRKYCSRQCQSKYWVGKPSRHKTGSKNSVPAWNKGIPALKGSNNPSWKGDKVGYHGLHKWVQSVLGKPCQCEFCGTEGLTKQKIHWANKSGDYKRVKSDWLRLCAGCHLKYDRN